MSEINWYELLC